jgi:2-C-methyl-D-erythritol 4-phosphate cytidylyltransferase
MDVSYPTTQAIPTRSVRVQSVTMCTVLVHDSIRPLALKRVFARGYTTATLRLSQNPRHQTDVQNQR